MNAKEAKEIAYKINTDNKESQYSKIKKNIDAETFRGKYKTFVYEHILDDVEDKLKKEGFIISSNLSVLNEICIEISWK